ncbi:mCG1039592, isoform CRA_b [Mus musculus]|nr:mCG1039592, isoform CRA_b [Mus musculus]
MPRAPTRQIHAHMTPMEKEGLRSRLSSF